MLEMNWFRRHYGAGPLHLIGLLACFAIAAYAVTRVLGQSGWLGVLLWFPACLVLHDLIGFPVYASLDRMLLRPRRRQRDLRRSPRLDEESLPTEIHRRRALVPWVNYIRFPAVISGVLLGMFFPLIFRISNTEYIGVTGFNEDAYLVNWLAVTAVLFAGSAVTYLLRTAVARRSAHT